jgi:hypothetical protein
MKLFPEHGWLADNFLWVLDFGGYRVLLRGKSRETLPRRLKGAARFAALSSPRRVASSWVLFRGIHFRGDDVWAKWYFWHSLSSGDLEDSENNALHSPRRRESTGRRVT